MIQTTKASDVSTSSGGGAGARNDSEGKTKDFRPQRSARRTRSIFRSELEAEAENEEKERTVGGEENSHRQIESSKDFIKNFIKKKEKKSQLSNYIAQINDGKLHPRKQF